ncbi:MAG: glutaminase B [Shewanellaceae bacterium]|nr:glutaminase B [Shewanellaceae bacterium]
MPTVAVLEQVIDEARQYIGQGKVANYIPALAQIDPNKIGIAVCHVDGTVIGAGDYQEAFSIQSISKVLSLTLALQESSDADKEVWTRVGKNQSGNAFNSLVQVEMEHGIPRNPFINAGALVVCDFLTTKLKNPHQKMLQMVRDLSLNDAIEYDQEVAQSEYEHSARNAAIAYLMKSFGNFHNDVPSVLKNYFSYCALKMSCVDLAKTFVYLANEGQCLNAIPFAQPQRTRRINSLLATSGLYDGAGEFAFRVGMPGKSGVGGGIIGIVPKKFSICVWSPELDEFGNSLPGLVALESFVQKLGYSVY